MFVACSSMCFGRMTLEQALYAMGELRFAKVDLAIRETGGHLKPSEVHADLNRVVQILRVSAMTFSAFHVDFGPSAVAEDVQRDRLKSVCRLARNVAVPVVSLAAAPLGSDLDDETRRLTAFTRIAESEGLILAVETRGETVTGDPLGAAELCRRIPGMGLTLDPSHYTVGPHAKADYDMLFPLVRHVRLRDSGREQFSTRIGQGEIDYGRIVGHLDRVRYTRALSVDIHDDPLPDFPVDVEARKLKYLLESMV